MAQQKITKSKTVAESAREAKKAEQHAKIEAARARATEARIKAREAAKGRSAGFVNFIREQGVVGLAVGLAIGTAAGASVKVIVDQLINPLVALVTQGVDLSKLSWAVKVGHSNVTFGYGAVVSSLITLIATALVVYLVIHLAKLDRLDKKKD
jgi:large conductance mechanosensitive channel